MASAGACRAVCPPFNEQWEWDRSRLPVLTRAHWQWAIYSGLCASPPSRCGTGWPAAVLQGKADSQDRDSRSLCLVSPFGAQALACRGTALGQQAVRPEGRWHTGALACCRARKRLARLAPCLQTKRVAWVAQHPPRGVAMEAFPQKELEAVCLLLVQGLDGEQPKEGLRCGVALQHT